MIVSPVHKKSQLLTPLSRTQFASDPQHSLASALLQLDGFGGTHAAELLAASASPASRAFACTVAMAVASHSALLAEEVGLACSHHQYALSPASPPPSPSPCKDL